MSAQIQFVGRLGRDPESRTVGANAVTSLAVAVDVGFGDKRSTVWYDVSVWGKQGEAAKQNLAKGAQVFIAGEHEPREYQGKDGATKTAQGVRCTAWQFVGTRPQTQVAPAPQQRPIPPASSYDYIPF